MRRRARPLGAGAGACAGAAGRRRIAGRASAEAESAAEPVLRRPSMPGAQAAVEEGGERVVTVEEQREVAKELISYFKEQSLRQSVRSESLLGWTRANEISNGRWVMFGILVGLLTEYATGVNFVDQIRITISNLGIADVNFVDQIRITISNL